PVGETRFEIVLPTGGAHQARIEEEAWADLLRDVKANPDWQAGLAGDDLATVPQGQPRDLALRVQQDLNWSAVKNALREKYPAVKGNAAFDAVPAGQTQKLVDA